MTTTNPAETRDNPWAKMPVPEWLRPHVAEALRKAPAKLHRLLGEQCNGSFSKTDAILARFSMMTHGHEWLPDFVVGVLREGMPLRALVRALEVETLKARLADLCGAAGAGRMALALWLDPRPEVKGLATAEWAANTAQPDDTTRAPWAAFAEHTFMGSLGVPAWSARNVPGATVESCARTEELRRRVREAEDAMARERSARREEGRLLHAEVEEWKGRVARMTAEREALEAGIARRVSEAVEADRAARMTPWLARAMEVEDLVEAGASEAGLPGLLERARSAVRRHEAMDPHGANVARLRAEMRVIEEQRDEARMAVESALHRCPELEEVIRRLDEAMVERRRLVGEAPASRGWVQDLAMEVATAVGKEALAGLRLRIETLAGQGLIGTEAHGWLAGRLLERESVLDEPALQAGAGRREARLMDVIQGRAPGRILVDTFNWIGQAGEELGVSREPDQFLASIKRLEPWMRQLGRVAGMADIRFVADGPHASHRTLGKTVRVEWSGGEGRDRADKVIVGMLVARRGEGPSWVVTADHALAAACRHAGAIVEPPVGFTRRALKAGVAPVGPAA